MADHRKIVDELRSLLQSSDLTQWTELQLELIRQYTALCRDAGRRLSECESLLNKHLYSETVQLAQAEPDLLDLVTILDIPERETLEQVCLSQKLPSPPALNLATAQAIEQAYLKVQPLDDLLKQHRLLALARAPLLKRRKVLQQIADRDHDNPVWQQDLKQWESEIYKQLQEKLKLNVFLNDVNQVLKYAEAIHDKSWLVPAPASLLKELEKAVQTAEQVKARQTFMSLTEKLQEAFYRQDVKAARAIRADWQQTCQAAGLSFKSSQNQHVFQAFQWLDELDHQEQLQENQDRARRQLINAFETQAPVEKVQDRWNDFINSGAKPEPALKERYERHLNRRLELRQDRRKLTWILAGLGVTALITIITIAVLQLNKSTRIEQAYTALSYYLEQHKLDEYQNYYDRMIQNHATLANEARIADLHREYRNRKSVIQQRSKQISDVISEIRQLPESEKGETTLQRAHSLIAAALEPEKKQLQQAMLDHESRYLNWVKTESENISSTLEKSVKELSDAANPTKSAIDQQRKTYNSLNSAMSKLEVSASQKEAWLNRLKQFDQIIKTKSRIMDEQEAVASLHASLTTTLHQPGNRMKLFSDAINRFLAQYREHSSRPHWMEVMKEIAPAESASEIGDLLIEIRGNPFKLTPQQVKEYQHKIDRAIEQFKLPHHQQLLILQDVLRRREICLPSHVMLEEMTKYLKKPGITDTSMIVFNTVENAPVKKLYVKKSEFENCNTSIKMGNENKLVTYFSNLSGKEAVREYTVKGFKLLKPKSPQSEIAELWHEMMNQYGNGWKSDLEWRTSLVRFLEEVIQKEHLDPVVKLDLVRSLLDRGGRGSLVFEKAVKPWADHIKTKIVRERTVMQFNWSIEWIDPESSDAVRLRADCDEIMTSMPRFIGKSVLEQMAEVERSLLREISIAPQLAGWIQKVSDTQWKCEGLFARFPEGSDVVVLQKTSAQNQLSWQKIGTLKSRTVVMEEQISNLREGVPCFVVLSADSILRD